MAELTTHQIKSFCLEVTHIMVVHLIHHRETRWAIALVYLYVTAIRLR